jgi:DNA primase
MDIQEQYKVYASFIGDFKVPYKGRSPFRDDKHASFGIYRKGNNLYFKDFAGDSGNVFKFIELMGGLRGSYTPSSFKEKKPVNITYELYADFPQYSLEYWAKRRVSHETLVQENVLPLKWIDFEYYTITCSPQEPLFMYWMDDDVYKVYNPLAIDKKKKFRNVNTERVIAGKFPPYKNDTLYILGSKKDMLVFKEHTQFLAADYIDLLSESTFNKLVQKLKEDNHYTKIYALLDWDDSNGEVNVKKGVEWTQAIEECSEGMVQGIYLKEPLRQKLLSMNIKDIDELALYLTREQTELFFRKLLSA